MKLFYGNNIQTYVGTDVPLGSTVILTLSQNAVTLVGNVVAQTRYSISTDSTGSFSQEIWFTDEMNPSGLGYRIQVQVPNVGIVYDQQNVPITGANFNLANFVPGSQSTATGIVLPTFETNGTTNTDQSVLNLRSGTGITLSSDSNGGVTITGAAQGVTSVGLADSTGLFTITGSPVTTTGTLTLSALASQTANHFFAAPNGSNGAPTFRVIAVADVPTLNQNTTGSAGSATTAAGLTGTPNITVGTISATTFTSSGHIEFSSQTLAAAGTTQGTATLLTADNCYVTSGTGGVILPTAVQGMEISITNDTAASIVVYPASGAAIETLSANIGVTIPAYVTIALEAKSTTQWWTIAPVVVAGSNITLTEAGSGTVTIALAAAPTISGLITGQANIQLGVAGTTSGVITLEGSTSGSATISGPAVAGTITNPISLSNSIMVGGGVVLFNDSTGNQGQIAFVPAGATYFDYLNTLNFRAITNGRATLLALSPTVVTALNLTVGTAGSTAGIITLEGLTSGAATITAPAVAGTAANPILFSNGINTPSGTGHSWNNDTFLFRSSANVVGVGNAIGNQNGTIWAAAFYTGSMSMTGTAINSITVPTAAGAATFTQTIGSGTQALGTTLIASGAASAIISTAVAGVLATDNLLADFNLDPILSGSPPGVVGYTPSAAGMLTIIKFCTAGHINFYQYNNTGNAISPGAMTLNYRIVR